LRVSARDVYSASADGLKLYARDFGPERGDALPVLCLAGLTRNSQDFETIAPHLALSRRVICPDYRGRGRSEHSPDPKTYRPDIELDDALRLLDQLGVHRVAVIGTSRGGIIAMVMAAKAKDRLAGICFNDVGPRIEAEGLLRIRSYLGVAPRFETFEQAVASIRATNPGFRNVSDAQWMAFTRRIFRDENGRPGTNYDLRLGESFPSADEIAAGKLADIWPLFDLTVPLPAVVLRGEFSDLLTADTVAEMQRRHPALSAVTVKDRAHVPFLDEPECIAAIDTWLAAVDGREAAL
jgi:pimeloyl-ACP methyl ester carboxylesterase